MIRPRLDSQLKYPFGFTIYSNNEFYHTHPITSMREKHGANESNETSALSFPFEELLGTGYTPPTPCTRDINIHTPFSPIKLTRLPMMKHTFRRMFECQFCAVCPHPVTKPLFPSLTSCCARNSLGRQTETRQGIQLIKSFALEKALCYFYV